MTNKFRKLKYIISGILIAALCVSNLGISYCAAAASPAADGDGFTLVFENTESYLYRIGNSDSISVGSLFSAADDSGIDDSSVEVTVIPQTTVNGSATDDADSDFSYVYVSDTDAWGNGTLSFSGTGVVEIVITDDSDSLSLMAEVVDGINIESGELVSSTSQNIVLLSNSSIDEDSVVTISGNATLYGNGFMLDISMGSVDSTNRGVLTLSSSNLDNVKIIGKAFTGYSGYSGGKYSVCAVLASGDCEITNSYISGCRSPLRIEGSVNNTVKVSDTVLDGGRYCNIDVRTGNLSLEDVITVNEPIEVDGETVMGYGIVVNYENSDDVTITVNGLTQYNWVCADDADDFIEDFSTSITDLLNSGGEYVQCYIDSDGIEHEFVNLGIISLNENITDDAVSGTGYTYYSDWYSFEETDAEGYGSLWSYGSDYKITSSDLCYRRDINLDYEKPADVWSADTQTVYSPVYTWNYPEEYSSDLDAVVVSFESDSSFTLDSVSTFLSAQKHGQQLDISITLADSSETSGAVYSEADDSLTFYEAGTWQIVYSITDPLVYLPDGSRSGEAVTRTQILSVQVSVTDSSISAPDFSFTVGDTAYSGDDIVVIDSGGLNYVMPDVDSTSDDIGSITTEDGDTIYYVIVKGSCNLESLLSNLYRYYPLYSGVSITDYTETSSVTYDSETLEKADGLVTALDQGDNGGGGWAQSGAAANGWDSYSMDTDGEYYCMKTSALNSANSNWTAENTYWVKYSFSAGNGATYYYYIGYHFSEIEVEDECIAEGTLITLADGSQTAVENLTGDEELLVFDHETGTFTASSIIFIEKDGIDTYDVINLGFSNGETVRIIYEHALFDLTLNQYVYINAETLYDYIGHEFAVDSAGSICSAVLESVSATSEETGCYSLVTEYQLNYFVDGFLSIPGGISGLFNIFEYGDNLAYDTEKMAADIAEYGLFTYEDLCDYVSEEIFDVFNGQYLKVSIGKELITMDDIIALADKYSSYF